MVSSSSRVSGSAARRRGRGGLPRPRPCCSSVRPKPKRSARRQRPPPMPIDPIEDIQSDAEYRRDLVRAVTRRALEQCGPMSAPTKGSGTTWVGRSIRRLEDPALVQGRGHFTADLAGGALGSLRAQPGGLGPHRTHQVRRPNASVFTGADLRGVKPIKPMLHKFNYVPVATADPAARRRAVCRRAGRRRCRAEQGGGRGHRRSRRDRDRTAHAGDRRPSCACRRRAGRSCRSAGECHRGRQGQDAEF